MPHYRLAHWFALVGMLLALGACGTPPSPQTGLKAEILTNDFPPQSQEVMVQAVITSHWVDVDNLQVAVHLSPGIRLIKEQVRAPLQLKAKSPHTVHFKVLLAEAGQQRISVLATGVYSGADFASVDTLFLLIDQAGTRSSREPST